eukprot:169895-Chlamydomonas_euryale.AAC.1
MSRRSCQPGRCPRRRRRACLPAAAAAVGAVAGPDGPPAPPRSGKPRAATHAAAPHQLLLQPTPGLRAAEGCRPAAAAPTHQRRHATNALRAASAVRRRLRRCRCACHRRAPQAALGAPPPAQRLPPPAETAPAATAAAATRTPAPTAAHAAPSPTPLLLPLPPPPPLPPLAARAPAAGGLQPTTCWRAAC